MRCQALTQPRAQRYRRNDESSDLCLRPATFAVGRPEDGARKRYCRQHAMLAVRAVEYTSPRPVAGDPARQLLLDAARGKR